MTGNNNPPLIYPKESIKDIAESLNVNNLSDEIATALAQDVEYRLNQVIQESIKFMRHSQRDKLMVDDINHALRVQNVEPLYGFNGPNTIDFKKITHNSQDLYYLNDTEVSFDALFDAPLPAVPPEMSFTAHWLAIEGVQPLIPQNPVEKEAVSKPSPAKKHKQSHEETADLSKPEVKTAVKHKLSKELQVYFEKIASAVVSSEESVRLSAYQSLSEDPGLNQLLPYFVHYCNRKVSENLKNLQILNYILNMISAIMRSPWFDISPYLHQLLPCIMTCIVGGGLGSNPSENHWATRRHAAQLIAKIYREMGPTHPGVKQKIIATLMVGIVDSTKSLSGLYGAITTILMLGNDLVWALVVRHLKPLGNRLCAKLTDPNPHVVTKARHSLNVIVDALQQLTTKDSDRIPSDLPQPDEEEVTDKLSGTICQAIKECEDYAKIWWVLKHEGDVFVQTN